MQNDQKQHSFVSLHIVANFEIKCKQKTSQWETKKLSPSCRRHFFIRVRESKHERTRVLQAYISFKLLNLFSFKNEFFDHQKCQTLNPRYANNRNLKNQLVNLKKSAFLTDKMCFSLFSDLNPGHRFRYQRKRQHHQCYRVLKHWAKIEI